MAKDGTNRGRPRRIALQLKADGSVEVSSDGGCDVVLMDDATSSAVTLTTRTQVILRRDTAGKITVKEAPPGVRVEIVQPIP